MIDKLKIMWMVTKSKLTVGFSGGGKDGNGYIVGNAVGIDAVLASIVLTQLAVNLKETYKEALVDEGFARKVSVLEKDWSTWLSLARDNPAMSPSDIMERTHGK